jgi:hypothetical protein
MKKRRARSVSSVGLRDPGVSTGFVDNGGLNISLLTLSRHPHAEREDYM